MRRKSGVQAHERMNTELAAGLGGDVRVLVCSSGCCIDTQGS
jgi:hypothetical protein